MFVDFKMILNREEINANGFTEPSDVEIKCEIPQTEDNFNGMVWFQVSKNSDTYKMLQDKFNNNKTANIEIIDLEENKRG